jgi:NADH-quinone oxidoreductase subunit N
MNHADYLSLAPLLVTAATAVAVLLAIAVRRSHAAAFIITACGLILALLSLGLPLRHAPRGVTPLLLMDGFTLAVIGLVLAATLGVALFAHGYLARLRLAGDEFYVLLLLVAVGACVLAAADHFAALFLGMETTSIALYGLIGYRRGHRLGLEAAIKYLVLAGVTSAFVLFGIALIYADTGSLLFMALANGNSLLLPAGIGLLLVGLAFKLAFVPFHLWIPDVYEGASAPVAALIATVAKLGAFAALFNLLWSVMQPGSSVCIAVILLAVLSMFVGNLLALQQKNIKRLLAYSSIAHFGYLLVVVIAEDVLLATIAALVYLTAYTLTTLGAFGVMIQLSNADGDADHLEAYRGLAWRRPWLAGVMTAMLLSLAGIPLTAGFIAKFVLLSSGVDAQLWLPIFALVISSVIGLYYYLRILLTLYRAPEAQPASAPLPFTGGVALAVLLLGVLWLGIYPAPFLTLLEHLLTYLR